MAKRQKYKLEKLLTEPAPWEVDLEAFIQARRSAGGFEPGEANRGVKARRRLQAERRKANQAKREAERPQTWRMKWKRERDAKGRLVETKDSAWRRVLAVMQPGLWYAAPDLARLSGVSPGAAKDAARELWRRGLAELGRSAEKPVPGPGWSVAPCIPKNLWRRL
jgi:hypothetical protein